MRTRSWWVALVVAAVLLPACSGDAAANHPTASPASSLDPAARAAEREARSPDPSFDFGFTIQITRDGFHPAWLVASCCQAITWKNLTQEPVSVAFDHQAVKSGPIPPGGTFVFTPQHVESITYHAEGQPAMKGALQVNQTFES